MRRFDLPPADLDHAMIRVGDSAQVVVVRANNYKEWALDVPPARSKKQVTTTDKTTTRSTRPMLGLPYIQGLSEQLSRPYQAHGVYVVISLFQEALLSITCD